MVSKRILRHVSIDLETMATPPPYDCAIVSIGAVVFDPRYSLKVPNSENSRFYRELDWEDQDRRICVDVAKWWQRQPAKAKQALYGLDDLEDVLRDLAVFLPGDCRVWGNGATFDISILEDAYAQYGLPVPWKYWNVRDMRTIHDMYESARGGLNHKSGGILHNALDDAVYQAQAINLMWTRIVGEADV